MSGLKEGNWAPISASGFNLWWRHAMWPLENSTVHLWEHWGKRASNYPVLWEEHGVHVECVLWKVPRRFLWPHFENQCPPPTILARIWKDRLLHSHPSDNFRLHFPDHQGGCININFLTDSLAPGASFAHLPTRLPVSQECAVLYDCVGPLFHDHISSRRAELCLAHAHDLSTVPSTVLSTAALSKHMQDGWEKCPLHSVTGLLTACKAAAGTVKGTGPADSPQFTAQSTHFGVVHLWAGDSTRCLSFLISKTGKTTTASRKMFFLRVNYMLAVTLSHWSFTSRCNQIYLFYDLLLYVLLIINLLLNARPPSAPAPGRQRLKDK